MDNRKTGSQAPIQLMWNDSMGDGWLLIDTSFYGLDDVTQLDMLKDFINALQEEYDEQRELIFGE